MFDEYVNLEDDRDDRKTSVRKTKEDSSVRGGRKRSGSRYADKQTKSTAKRRFWRKTDRRRKKSGAGKRFFPKETNWRQLFTVSAVVLAVLGVWLSAIVLLPIKKEDPENERDRAAPLVSTESKRLVSEDGSAEVRTTGDGEAQAAEHRMDETGTGTEKETEEKTERETKKEKSQDNLIDLKILDSPYAALMDAETGEFLAAERGDEKIFPASMTKMLTVLVAIEHIPNLDETIYMSEDYYQQLYDEDASRAGFEPGEPARIRDLLYGALLPSGAECCIELARQAAGTESAFVELMNQKAADLGLVQTKFVNCTGLHNVEQFSTCGEIAKIVRAAIQNETFFDVFTTHRYSVNPSSIHPEGFTFWSTLFKSTVDEIVTGGEIIGGKTGFTEEAGRCLASLARIWDHLYILVTAGWSSNPEDEMYHINDAFRAYNALGSVLE